MPIAGANLHIDKLTGFGLSIADLKSAPQNAAMA